jgi:hypothetical protein
LAVLLDVVAAPREGRTVVGARVGGTTGTRVGRSVTTTGARVGRSVTTTGARVGRSVTTTGARVGRSVTTTGARVGRSVTTTGARVGRSVTTTGARVGRSVTTTGARVGDTTGARVGRSLEGGRVAGEGRVDAVSEPAVTLKAESELEPEPERCSVGRVERRRGSLCVLLPAKAEGRA